MTIMNTYPPRRRGRTTVVLAAVAVGLLLGTLAMPSGIRLGGERTGDAELARTVRQAAWPSAGHLGLSVALVENGAVRTAGLGTTRLSGGRPVDERTPFEFGSVTKTMTGMILADMVARKEVSPQTTVGELFPDTTFRDPAVAGASLEELASQRSGIPSVPPSLNDPATLVGSIIGGNPYGGQSPLDVVDDAAGSRAVDKGRVVYSNLGIALLGQALAARAGTSYQDLLRRRILEPLGMRDTTLVGDPADVPADGARGYITSGHATEFFASDGYLPSGAGGWSTSADLGRFLAATIDGTAPGADAARPRWDIPDGSRIGYAWQTTDGITWHDGSTAGFSSFVGFDPERRRGIVILGNTSASVVYLGMRLLGRDAPTPSERLIAELPMAGITLLCLVAAARTVEVTARRGSRRLLPGPDRLMVVSMSWRAVALLSVAWTLGSWKLLWPPLWALAVALSVAGVTLGVLRWSQLPTARGPRPRLRWVTSVASVSLWTAVAAVVATAWIAR
ncbi:MULTISPECIES: serine hydrolase domain-containing protein [unclassified Micromonospora]|uniref:serine hydrolase domain-containing protein n=1 Tax=unclassified Micromonospora TaxID=2617518 RepID=UPI00331FC8FF